jgi:mono/diheme cytochrome c family protein
VYVQSRGDYQKWVASAVRPVATGGFPDRTGGLTAGQRGAALYEKYQCASCHSQEAVQRGRGPSLVGLFGKTRQLANGKKVVADDGYLRNVLYYPQDYPLAGWPQGMPSYKGSLSEEDVLQINAYVKTLSAANPEPGGPQMQGNGVGIQESQKPEMNNGGAEDREGARAANTDNQQWRYMYGGER